MLKKSIAPTTQLRPKSPRSNWARSTIYIQLLLTLNFALLTTQCGLDVEDPSPPSPPVWVQKSLPEEWPERGIDAHESGGIVLEWQPNLVEENVTSYLVYRAEYFHLEDSLGDFELHTTLISELEYIDMNTTVNSHYQYVIVAEDASENQSAPSDTLDYIRLGEVRSTLMFPNGLSTPLNSHRNLQWTYSYNIAMENYTMTILNSDNGLILRRELTPRNYIGSAEYFTVPDTILLTQNRIYKWRVDMGGRFVEGRETAGSESAWATFLYMGE